jgi:hypothetical protein
MMCNFTTSIKPLLLLLLLYACERARAKEAQHKALSSSAKLLNTHKEN